MAIDHKGKIALVTGANKGIGFEVARQLGAGVSQCSSVLAIRFSGKVPKRS